MRRFYEAPLAISEQRAIKFVEAQLGETLRDDGPILGWSLIHCHLAHLARRLDPRLLGEIHIALLRTVIEDIEDVARTPDPNSAGILAGGHPQIVERMRLTGHMLGVLTCIAGSATSVH